jgi:hypothetical protein
MNYRKMAEGGEAKTVGEIIGYPGSQPTPKPTSPPNPKMMAEGGDTDDDDSQLMDQVCDEFMQAFEKKDKGLLMEALKALVLHIQDEDKEQDAGQMG